MRSPGAKRAPSGAVNYRASMETLLSKQEAGVLTVTLNRRERKNAVDSSGWRALEEAFAAAAHDPYCRVVVVTGAGGDFCSGADLSEQEGSEVHALSEMRAVHDAALALHRLPQPTIAKVDGIAAGAGVNLALGCDLVVASERARFSQIFTRRGLSLDFGGSWILPRRIGLHRAKELAFFGDIIGSAEAERIGLVNRVVAVDELDATVEEWATRLAAGPPIALALTKQLLDASLEASFADALDHESSAQAVCLASKDTAEAMSAFFEKREPRFVGM